jgi:hypothetical protein
MATQIAQRNSTRRQAAPAATVVAQETTAQEQVLDANDILNNFTVAEFKEMLGIASFEVLKHKTLGTMFLASKGGSIGTVSHKIDWKKELQVIEIADRDGGENVFILCNRGSNNYETFKTL